MQWQLPSLTGQHQQLISAEQQQNCSAHASACTVSRLKHHSNVSAHGGCRHHLRTVHVLKHLKDCSWLLHVGTLAALLHFETPTPWLLQVGAERYNLFQGCPKARTATMVLRGGSEQFIDEAERSLHDAIMIVRRALKNASVVAGGGAIDMEISRWGSCLVT